MRRVSVGVLIAVLAAFALWIGYGSDLWYGAKPRGEAGPAGYSKLHIERFSLDNGMEVIVLPNHRVPAISHMLWLRVGAADDPQHKSGLAHYHEHLMFKGTRRVPAGEYSKRLQALGGEFNAFTGADFTGYYVNIARDNLEKVMQLESDRLRNLSPAPEDYAKELSVIIEEWQTRIGNQPEAQWDEQLQAALFLNHPYRIPIIGWRHEIDMLTPEDAKAFYEQYYHAGNIVLVVAGDITRKELEPMVRKYYGVLPAKPANVRHWPKEPPAAAARRLSMEHAEVRQPRFQRRYMAPSYGTNEGAKVMPLALLSEWIGGGQTSLLYEQIVKRQQLAVSVSAAYSGLSLGPAQLVISATPAEGVSLEKLEAAIDAALQTPLNKPIAQADLARIQTLYKASATYARDSLSALAHYAGYLAMLNLPLDYLRDWDAHVMAVSPSQMLEVAKEVLRPERSVTGYLLPAKVPAADAKPAPVPTPDPAPAPKAAPEEAADAAADAAAEAPAVQPEEEVRD